MSNGKAGTSQRKGRAHLFTCEREAVNGGCQHTAAVLGTVQLYLGVFSDLKLLLHGRQGRRKLLFADADGRLEIWRAAVKRTAHCFQMFAFKSENIFGILCHA